MTLSFNPPRRSFGHFVKQLAEAKTLTFFRHLSTGRNNLFPNDPPAGEVKPIVAGRGPLTRSSIAKEVRRNVHK